MLVIFFVLCSFRKYPFSPTEGLEFSGGLGGLGGGQLNQKSEEMHAA